ncbi:hypothetical protein EUTSA_v10010980mg [Eutrema salsugineum]|uniref:DUF7610 domain-containing protein n=1 Tax=Eutrema salsugineum TaxID=72664 RepID=V4L671_EUTSA|nr:hypothetical protein EUTSA_v10010980mg [Eutrema salsugineum]
METTKVMINSVLEKKLEELESLREAIITFNEDDPNVYRDIELRVIFAKTLLLAEISSRPMDMEGEIGNEERLKLACMAKRLNELEEVFKTYQVSGHDNGSVIESETESKKTNDGVVDGETGSVNSWVESCPNEVTKTEEGKEKEEDAEQWLLFQDASSEEEKKEDTFPADVSSEEKKETKFPAEAAVKEEVVVREVKEKVRLGFRAMVCFGLIGFVGGMVSLLGYIGDSMEDDFYLTPT